MLREDQTLQMIIILVCEHLPWSCGNHCLLSAAPSLIVPLNEMRKLIAALYSVAT